MMTYLLLATCDGISSVEDENSMSNAVENNVDLPQTETDDVLESFTKTEHTHHSLSNSLSLRKDELDFTQSPTPDEYIADDETSSNGSVSPFPRYPELEIDTDEMSHGSPGTVSMDSMSPPASPENIEQTKTYNELPKSGNVSDAEMNSFGSSSPEFTDKNDSDDSNGVDVNGEELPPESEDILHDISSNHFELSRENATVIDATKLFTKNKETENEAKELEVTIYLRNNYIEVNRMKYIKTFTSNLIEEDPDHLFLLSRVYFIAVKDLATKRIRHIKMKTKINCEYTLSKYNQHLNAEINRNSIEPMTSAIEHMFIVQTLVEVCHQKKRRDEILYKDKFRNGFVSECVLAQIRLNGLCSYRRRSSRKQVPEEMKCSYAKRYHLKLPDYVEYSQNILFVNKQLSNFIYDGKEYVLMD